MMVKIALLCNLVGFWFAVWTGSPFLIIWATCWLAASVILLARSL